MAAGSCGTEPWCEVLYVSSNATLDEVGRAYRELAKHFHPDVWTSASEKQKAMAAARMKSINAAFERAKEDISLREGQRAAEAAASAGRAAEAAAAAARARKVAAEAAAARQEEEDRMAAAAASARKTAADAAAAKRAEEERMAAAAAAQARKAAVEAAAANEAEKKAPRRKMPNGRGPFTRTLGPSLASLALILLAGYVIRAVQTQHAPEHERMIADLPQPGPSTPRPGLVEAAPAPENADRTTEKLTGRIEKAKGIHLESGPIVLVQQTQTAAAGANTDRVRRDPRAAADYIERGINNCRMGNLNQAIEDLTEAIRIAPRTAKAYHNWGVVRILQGNFDLAIKDFDAALAIDPTYSAASANRKLAVQKKREEEQNAALPSPQSSNPRITVENPADRNAAVRGSEEYYRKRAAAKRAANSP